MPTKTKSKPITNASESTEVIPPAEIAEPLGVVPPEDVEIEEILSKQIRCTPTGVIIDGELPLQKWIRGFEFFQTLRSKTQWWRGDMLIHGEKHYGESHAQAVDIHGKSESRLATYVYVCTKFPIERRRPELSFDHHAECASLDPREADRVLLEAIKMRWTKMDVREETARINERNGIPSNRRGRKPGSTAAKVAASGKQPQIPEGEKPLIWNGHPLRVMIMPDATRVILQGSEPLPTDEADRAAHEHGHAHGPNLAKWLEEHNFIKGGDEPCAQTKTDSVNSTEGSKPESTPSSNNSEVSQLSTSTSNPSASEGATPDATAPAPTPPPLHFAAIEVVDKERDGVISPKGETFEDINNFAHDPDVSFEDMQGALISLAIKHQVLRNEAAITPAAPPASPEPPKATETPHSVADELLAIMATYHEQIERGDVLTLGGLEHMGDVWRLLLKWETALRKEAPTTNGAPPASPAIQSPLDAAERHIRAFNTAAKEVPAEQWQEIGANKLLRLKWLENLLFTADDCIDKIQAAMPK